MNAYWYIFNGILIFTMPLFTCLNLTPKINKYLTFFIIFVPIISGAFMINQFESISQTVFATVPLLWYTASSFLLFKDKIQTRIFIIVLILSSQFFIPLIGEGFSRYFGMTEYTLHDTVFFILATALFVIGFSIMTYYRQKGKGNRRHIANLPVFIIFPLSQLIISFSCILLFGADKVFEDKALALFGTNTNFFWIIMAIGAVLSIVADVIMFLVMNRTAQNESLREEIRFREYQDNLNLEYYHALEQNAEETRKIKHDLNNILQMSYALFKSGDRIEQRDSENLMSQLRKSIEGLQVERYSSNALINVVLSNKIKRCRELGIKCHTEININEAVKIDDIDICRVFTNLLDNAINAVNEMEGEDRSFLIESHIDGDILYIKTRNKALQFKNEHSAKGDHGYGLHILEDIAQKHRGSFITKTNDGEFTALLAMKTNI